MRGCLVIAAFLFVAGFSTLIVLAAVFVYRGIRAALAGGEPE